MTQFPKNCNISRLTKVEIAIMRSTVLLRKLDYNQKLYHKQFQGQIP